MATTLLDIEAPLVRAVFAILDHGADYDAAIDILVAAERRHHVRIIREDAAGSLATTWMPQNPQRRLTIRQFRELMAGYPSPDVMHQLATQPDRPPPVWTEHAQRWDAYFRQGVDDDAPDAALFPFLTETSLLLCGTDFANDHWIEFPSGAVSSWTQRAWGGLLVRWALATE
jgi:hypothetical protein